MNYHETSSSACRICLQDGAVYPIFDESTTEASILSKLNKCFMEKIEDVEGYPRNICSSCKITLDMFCKFIEKYRASCEILRQSLVKVKTEVDISFSNYDNDFTNDDDDFVWDDKEYIEIKVENNNENINDASELLEKLKVPGLKITKVKSLKAIEEVSETTVKKNRSSKRKGVKPRKSKRKKVTKLKENVLERVKKLIETEEKEEKSREKILCDICGASFSVMYKLTRHIEGRHLDRKFTCSICSKQYNSEFYLRLHTQSVHSEKKFKCDQCSKEFKSKKSLRTHIMFIHEKEKNIHKKRTYTCKYCDKLYKCALSLTIHERSLHTGLRPAVCNVCGKAFYHEVYLKEHMRLHTGELPFKCPICERGYTQRGNMKSHLRQHKVSELNETIMAKMRPSYMKCLKNC